MQIKVSVKLCTMDKSANLTGAQCNVFNDSNEDSNSFYFLQVIKSSYSFQVIKSS